MTLVQHRIVPTLLLIAAFLLPLAASAQDVVTVGTVPANSGGTVDVPVYIRDVSGTALGIDQPADSRIESYSIKVSYAPAAAVSTVTFTRAGITANLTPTTEFNPSSAGAISLLDTFQESTNLIPFTLNGPPPGNQVAHLVFTLSPSATPGSTITLTLDPALTQLTDEGGSAATKESQGGGNLTLVNGAINVQPLNVTLSPSAQNVYLHATSSLLTATLSGPVGSATTVNLSSSTPSVATVPVSISIPAGQTSGTIPITSLALGSTTITATLPPASGGATSQATVTVIPPAINITPFLQTVPLGGTASMTLTITAPQPTATDVAMTTSDTTVATVAATVTIPANVSSTTFLVNGLKLGSTTVRGTLPAALGSGQGSANLEVSTVCLTPSTPVISAPAEAASGSAYDVTWPAVSNASEYAIDESLDAGFGSPTTKTVTNSATFSHTATTDTRYYYRVRARNHSGACDVTSPSSASVSVLVKAGVPPLVRVFPVVGSLPGANGSFFKTSVQLYNSKSVTITGKIVYHASGTSGADSDPALTYALAPGKTINYDDLLPAISKSGLGTADLIGDANSPLPVTSVRVFNDAGANGTSGLSEEAVKPEDALQAGDSGALIAPADFAKFRLNLGIRTLALGASLTVTVRDKDGIVVKTVEKSYGPTFFTQPGSSTLLDGFALTGGETLTFSITSGSAIIYGSTTDNITNDPSMQVVRKN